MADAEDPRALKTAPINQDDNINMVEVGTHKFFVHRHLLVSRFALFSEKLNNRTTPSISIRPGGGEGIEEATFETYVKYLYSGKIHCKTDDISPDHDGSRSDEEYSRLFVFAEKFKDTTAQNLIMDALLCKYDKVTAEQPTRWLPPDSTIAYFYKRTSTGSPLRAFFVNVCTWASTPELLTQTPNKLHDEFLLELAAHLLGKHVATRSSLDIPAHVQSCDYHTHVEGVDCASRKRKREAEEAEQLQRSRPRLAPPPNYIPAPRSGHPTPQFVPPQQQVQGNPFLPRPAQYPVQPAPQPPQGQPSNPNQYPTLMPPTQ